MCKVRYVAKFASVHQDLRINHIADPLDQNHRYKTAGQLFWGIIDGCFCELWKPCKTYLAFVHCSFVFLGGESCQVTGWSDLI